MEVGARPRSILDPTIGGRSTDLFFFNTIGEKIVQFLTETNSQRILRALGIPLSVRLSRGGNRTTGKDPADRPRARGRALFLSDRMGSESKGFRFRFWFGGFRAPLDLFRS